MGQAENKLEQFVKEIAEKAANRAEAASGPVSVTQPVVACPFTLPDGKFTLVNFASVNALPVSAETATVVGGLLKSKVLTYIGTEMVSGKSVQFFTKA